MILSLKRTKITLVRSLFPDILTRVTDSIRLGIPLDGVPTIQQTIGSPLQYGYRTKLTPHFQRPPFSFQKAQKRGSAPAVPDGKPDWLKIGFHEVGTRHVMDIEVELMHTMSITLADGYIRNVRSPHRSSIRLLYQCGIPLSGMLPRPYPIIL